MGSTGSGRGRTVATKVSGNLRMRLDSTLIHPLQRTKSLDSRADVSPVLPTY